MDRQYDNAIVSLRREETYRSSSRVHLAAALALAGREKEAHTEAQLFVADNSGWRVHSWADTRPYRRDEDISFWIEAFRLAGLPE